MDRIPSPFSYFAYRSESPALLPDAEEDIASIISLIDKADDQTLASLTQTHSASWRAADADALCSFFYAAKDSFDNSDAGRKLALFAMLTSWLDEVSSQLPDETRHQMLSRLADMAKIDVKEFSPVGLMIHSLATLLNMTTEEMMNQPGLYLDKPVTRAQAHTSAQLKEISAGLIKQYNAVVKQHSDMIQSVHDELLKTLEKSQ